MGRFYAVLAVAFLLVSGRLSWQYHQEAVPFENAFWETIEPITYEEAIQQRTALMDIAMHPPDDPETYYTHVLAPTNMLETRINRSLRANWRTRQDWGGLESVLAGLMLVKNEAQQSYARKFGHDRVAVAGEAFRASYRRPAPDLPSMKPYMVRWYNLTMLLAAVFMMLRVRQKGLVLWLEFIQPHQFLLAVIAWPVFIWSYPAHTPTQQLRFALRYAAATLGALLSFGTAGTAKAADGKDGSKKGRHGTWSLQLDFRFADTVSGPPAPEGFGRATITHPSKWFVESVNVAKRGFRLTSDTLGHPITSGRLGSVNGVAGAVMTNTGSYSAQTGIQIFGGTKRFGLVIPSLTVERQWAPVKSTTLATIGQVFVKPTHNMRLGMEWSVRKPSGAKTSWYLGALVGWSFGTGRPAVEGCTFHNSAGAEYARLRMTHALAF